MGGGGSFYDRDVRDGYRTTSRGTSADAEEKMSRSRVDAALLPFERTIACPNKSPVVFAFDVTGSMGTLPKIIYDKMPLIAGQIVENGYLDDPAMSLAAVGDVVSDRAPVQIGDFSLVKNLDGWLQRIWLEGNGGGDAVESYEFTAYFYARYCQMPNAETPFFIFTGDEGFRETLNVNELRQHFGGEQSTIAAKDVFDELKRKFKGNVFLIHRRYASGNDAGIVKQWEGVLGEERVIRLGSDKAIADVTLGVFALMTGARTLEEYLEDMKTKRDRAQTDDRVAEVRASLERLTKLRPVKAAASPPPAKKAGAPFAKKDVAGKTGTAKKPGRIF